jgi:hypothetical protein
MRSVDKRLEKLAIALRNMGHDEEADDAEEMIQRFYGDWVDQLPDVSAAIYGKGFREVERLVSEDYFNFEWAGQGSFRAVLRPQGDKDFVVKIAKNSHGASMNKSEFEMQQNFEGLFPKVHHHGAMNRTVDKEYSGEEFNWIVVENVRPINDPPTMYSYFPNLKKEMNDQRITYWTSTILGKLLYWEMGHQIGESRDHQPEEDWMRFVEDPEGLLDAAKKDPLFRRLAALSARLGIDARDLGVGNLGVDKNDNLLIIDSSLSKDFDTSPYIQSQYTNK